MSRQRMMGIVLAVAALASFFAVPCFSTPQEPTAPESALTFEQRVEAQEAIERVFYEHRGWAVNMTPKPSFEEGMSPKAIAENVMRSLAVASEAEARLGRPILDADLDAELARMRRDTRDADMLQELMDALGNDRLLLRECLARPALVERARFEAENLTADLAGLKPVFPESIGQSPEIYDGWTATSTTGAPAARQFHTAAWTGTELIVWGGANATATLNTGGMYYPATDSWVATSLTNAPAARRDHTAVWYGLNMTIWGGCLDLTDGSTTNTGAFFDPSTNSWTATSTGANCPSARRLHTAVAYYNWLPSVGGYSYMFVWGGKTDATTYTNTGALLDLNAGTWSTISMTSVPSARANHTAVILEDFANLTQKILIWGGDDGTNFLGDGSVFWTSVVGGWWEWIPYAGSPATCPTGNCPVARTGHIAALSDYGASWEQGLGQAYQEMVIWGGKDGSGGYLDSGAVYNVDSRTWRQITTTGAPSARTDAKAASNRHSTVIWGGFNGGLLGNGARYDAFTNTWTPIASSGAPTARRGHTLTSIDGNMVAWGGLTGSGVTSTGGSYQPSCYPDATGPEFTSITEACDSLTLNWSAGSGSPAAYNLYRSSGGVNCFSGGPWTKIAGPLPTSTTSYSDTSVARHIVYSYRLRGACTADGLNESAFGACWALYTHDVPPAPPATEAVSSSCDAVLVTMPPSPPSFGDYDTQSWSLYRVAGASCSGGTLVVGPIPTSPQYQISDTNLTPGGQYSYYWIGHGICGDSPTGACTTLTLPPAPTDVPTSVTASNNLCNKVVVDWTPPSGYTGKYWIKRESTCGGGAPLIYTGQDRPFTEWVNQGGHVAGTTYYYSVAISPYPTLACLGPYSACVAGVSIPPPAKPTNVTASGSCSEVVVSWDLDPFSTSYTVARYSPAGGVYCANISAIFSADTSPYHDTTTTYGGWYYKVYGNNVCGTGPASDCSTAGAVPPPPPAAPSAPLWTACCSNVNLSWAPVTYAESYDIYRATGPSCTGAVKINASPWTQTSYGDTGLTPSTQYSYYIVATDSCGSSPAGACATATTASATPGIPTGVTATQGCALIRVAWTGVNCNNGYTVYRGSNCGTSTDTFEALPGSSYYDDTTTSPGVTYFYWLKTHSICGGPDSAVSSCSTAAVGPGPTSAPANVTLSNVCADTLAWDPVPGAVYYDIYASSPTCGSSEYLVGTTASTTWTDNMVPYWRPWYRVKAVANCIESAFSACVAGSAPTAPAAPTGVNAFAACSFINITWSAVAGATSYTLYRGTICGTAVDTWNNATSPYFDNTAVPGTTYYYWVVAHSSCGDTAASSCSSANLRAAPTGTPAGVAAVGSCTGVTVSWSAVANADGYRVFRGSSCGTYTTYFDTTSLNYADTSGSAGTTYYYWVQATNPCGNGPSSSCVTGAKSPLPSTPAAPTKSEGCTGVTMTWSNVANATSYNILRASTCLGASPTTFTGVTSPYTDTTGTMGTTYYYWVQAVNSCGTTNGSCTSAMKLPPPSAPGSPTFSMQTCGGMVVQWSAVSGATSYDVYRATGPSCSGATKITTVGIAGFQDSGLSPSTSYSYYIIASGPCGTSTNGSCATGTTTAPGAPPAAPMNLMGFGNCGSNQLMWDPPMSPPYPASYTVYRGTSCGTATATFPNITPNNFTDTSGVKGQSYQYWVKANDSCGQSSSASSCVQIDQQSIGAPQNVVATGSCTNISVSWNPVSGASNYNIFRGSACGALTQIGTALISPYVDSTAVAGTTYQYAVQGEDSGDFMCYPFPGAPKSACAAAALTTTLAAPASVSATGGCSGVSVSWGSVTGASSYTIYRGASCGTGSSVGTSGTSPFNDSSAIAGTTYNFWVVATNSCATSPASSCATGTRLASIGSAPTGVTAVGDCQKISVSWNAVAGATSYTIWRGTSCGSVAIFSSSGSTTFMDFGTPVGTTYYYAIQATNSCGSGPPSSCASASKLASPPIAPTGVTATASCTGLTVSWSAVVGASFYIVYRGAVCGTPTISWNTGSLSYTDASAVQGTTYQYWVKAADNCSAPGSGAASSCASATVPVTPSAPVAPSFSNVACTTLTVSWSAVASSTGYDVYRATGGSCSGAVKVNGSPVSGTTFDDSGLTANTQYSYSIVALNGSCASSTGTCASQTTQVSCDPPPETSQGSTVGVAQTWTDKNNQAWTVNPTATSYKLVRGTQADLPQLLDGSVESCVRYTGTDLSANTPDDPTPVEGRFYWYLVIGVNPYGDGSAGDATAGTRVLNYSGTCP